MISDEEYKKLLKQFHKNNLMEEIMELAEFHSVDVLGIILQEVLEPENTQVYEKEKK